MTNDAAPQGADAYTLVELRDLDDSAGPGGFGDVMEARFARGALGCQQVGISLQKLRSGVRGPFAHQHDADEEVYVVLAGSGRAVVGGELIDLKPWSALRVAPGAVRAFEAGDDGLEFLAFGSHTENDPSIVAADWPSV